MKALFRRDLLTFTHPLFLGMFVGVLLMSLLSLFLVEPAENSPMDFIFMGAMQAMVISILPQSILGEDEHTGWQRWCMTMPIKRSHYVSEKYLLTLAFIVCSALLTSMSVISLMVQTTGFDFPDYLLVLSVIIGAPLLMMSIDMPMLFRFGTQKGLFVFVAAFLLIFVGGFALFAWSTHTDSGRQSLQQIQACDHLVLGLCILAVSAVIYTVSWLLSRHFYRKREF